MKKVMRNACVLTSFYAAVLLACVAVMSVLGRIFSMANGPMVGVGIWFIFCFGSLCVPDEVWNRWLLKK
ncbi:MAG: hypothetical protein IKU81_03640 [Oscillibacter sp.]|nr:hypothetical protein [Oscillibacter sp.]